MSAIDDLIVNLNEHRTSSRSEPIVTRVSQNVLAWQQVLAAIGVGSVSSVALSLPAEFNVTGSPGTGVVSIAATWKSELANTIFAAPNGAPGTPSFRSLVAADIPSLAGTYLALAGGAMTGNIAVNNSATPGLPALAFSAGTGNGLYWDTTNSALAASIGGAEIGWWDANGLQVKIPGGATSRISIMGEASTNTSLTRASSDTADALISLKKARGTVAAPIVVNQNDFLGDITSVGYTGSGTTYASGTQVRTQCIDPSPSTTAMGSRWFLNISPIGSVTPATVLQADNAGGLQMYGSNVVIDANRLLRTRLFTVATLPTAVDGAIAEISDGTLTIITGLGLAPIGGGTNHVPVFADNVGWKIL